MNVNILLVKMYKTCIKHYPPPSGAGVENEVEWTDVDMSALVIAVTHPVCALYEHPVFL